MNLWKSIGGMVSVRLTSGDPEGALQALNQAGIEIYAIEREDDLTCRFSVDREDFRSLERLVLRRGDSLQPAGRQGLFWTLTGLLHRPVLVGGLMLLLFLALFLPTRVLFVKVEGNSAVPARQIIAAAEECGIRFGAPQRQVRSEKVKNQLLSAVPQLQWAGVNTSGCTAVISVRERAPEPEEDPREGIAHLVAARDGFILSATATTGTLLVRPGQAVTRGEVLISGFTDCGITIRGEYAQGEIYALTSRELEAVTPSEGVKVAPTGEVKRKISLLIEKKRINLWKDSGISDATCGRMYAEYYITLPGGFALPVALCVETYIMRQTEPESLVPEQAEEELKAFALGCLSGLMHGGTVTGSSVTVEEADGLIRLRGTYACREMIGRVQHEQIGEANG